MKQLTIGIFNSREAAEEAINHVHNELDVPNDEISYLYRNKSDQVSEVRAEDISSDTPAEGAVSGAAIGGAIGGAIGIATVAGIIPVIGPVFVAGPLVTWLGLGAGAVGTTAAGALTGAAAGGLIGALLNIGVGEPEAQMYQDQVRAGNVLVAAHAEEGVDVAALFTKHGATNVNVYMLAV